MHVWIKHKNVPTIKQQVQTCPHFILISLSVNHIISATRPFTSTSFLSVSFSLVTSLTWPHFSVVTWRFIGDRKHYYGIVRVVTRLVLGMSWKTFPSVMSWGSDKDRLLMLRMTCLYREREATDSRGLIWCWFSGADNQGLSQIGAQGLALVVLVFVIFSLKNSRRQQDLHHFKNKT